MLNKHSINQVNNPHNKFADNTYEHKHNLTKSFKDIDYYQIQYNSCCCSDDVFWVSFHTI